MSYRVCIPTAGTGSRLGELTQYVNKALVTVANRPVIAHVIDQFPPDAECVIALGYKGELVREFLTIAYPKRKFFFVKVDPYEGPGSGLGYTLLSCRKHLQQPFVFCSNDTITTTPVPAPDHNWMSFAAVNDIAPYRTLRVRNGKVVEVCEKDAAGDDLQAYIGLAGIRDYKIFWKAMKDGKDLAVARGESHGMAQLVDQGITAYSVNWYDTGNLEMLERVRNAFQKPDAPNILDKPNEAIWFVDGTVIKFSADKDFIRNRVRRAKILGEYCPAIIKQGKYMYQYKETDGRILSEAADLPLFEKLLEYSQEFWRPAQLNDKAQKEFQNTCMKFYRDKTYERVALFYERFQKADGIEMINGEAMPSLASLLDGLDWDWIAHGLPGRFHGDFHFENILYSEGEDRFIFLDWRQDFGGSLEVGDIYYDLAKLNHGLIVCHELITRDMFSASWEEEIRFELQRKQILVECEHLFYEWLGRHGYDAKKVRAMTALIYLNIAALHHYPYCLLLFALGKQMLKIELQKQ